MSAQGFTVKMERNDPIRGNLIFTFSTPNTGTVEKFDESLNKKLHKGSALKNPLSIVQDHLRNEHIFTFTYIAQTFGGTSAWERKRTLQDYFQNVGKTWKLSFIHTVEGINEFWIVVPEKLVCQDLGGIVSSVRMILQFIETKNVEGAGVIP